MSSCEPVSCLQGFTPDKSAPIKEDIGSCRRWSTSACVSWTTSSWAAPARTSSPSPERGWCRNRPHGSVNVCRTCARHGKVTGLAVARGRWQAIAKQSEQMPRHEAIHQRDEMFGILSTLGMMSMRNSVDRRASCEHDGSSLQLH